MAASQEAIYEKFIILSADKKNSVDIRDAQFRVVEFDYYENILSPYITGTVTIVSSSNSAKSKDDTQERLGSLHSSLPLRAGCILLVKIKTEIGEELNYSNLTNEYKQLYVTDVNVLNKKSTSETLKIRFSSRTAWINETTRVTKHYKGKITNSVKKIIKDELKLEGQDVNIDDSSNSYSFTGMSKRPLDLIAMLAIRTVPPNTKSPGYFCFETAKGFNYISADTLIKQEPYKKTYRFDGKNLSTAETKDDSNNYKVSSFQPLKDQNLISQIRSGVYASKNIFFNPSTLGFTEIDISVEDKKLMQDPKFSTLGKKEAAPQFLFGGKKFHRIQTAIFDCGAEGLKTDVNNSPELYYAASSTRYNILFSQIYNVNIPCNTDLQAGNIIKLEVESDSDKKEQGPDQVKSGNYIIQALHHHFEPNKATTAMNLIRDSYGLHFSKGQ